MGLVMKKPPEKTKLQSIFRHFCKENEVIQSRNANRTIWLDDQLHWGNSDSLIFVPYVYEESKGCIKQTWSNWDLTGNSWRKKNRPRELINFIH